MTLQQQVLLLVFCGASGEAVRKKPKNEEVGASGRGSSTRRVRRWRRRRRIGEGKKKTLTSSRDCAGKRLQRRRDRRLRRREFPVVVVVVVAVVVRCCCVGCRRCFKLSLLLLLGVVVKSIKADHRPTTHTNRNEMMRQAEIPCKYTVEGRIAIGGLHGRAAPKRILSSNASMQGYLYCR